MFLRIEIKEKKHLGLSIREMWVYSALLYLSKNKPWNGSYSQLAELVDFPDKSQARKTTLALKKKGLVLISDDGLKACHIDTGQIDTKTGQIDTKTGQIDTLSKRKSNQKENIIKENKEVSECDNSAHTHTQEDLKDNNSVHSEHKRSVGTTRPTWQEWYAYGKEQGINYLTCLKSFAYYESIGWAKISNWRATLIYWDLKDKTK